MGIRILLVVILAANIGCRAESDSLIVAVDGRRLSLAPGEWRAMPNEAAYALNFEATRNTSPRQYQVLTLFLNQMSEDRKTGRAIGANEYLELFMSNPQEVTVLIRRDHGKHWLLSREMFRGIQAPGVDLSSVRPLADSDQDTIAEALRNEIDTTRHLLGGLVAR